MRNALIVALGLVCAALILTAPVDAQRTKITEVTGTVDVGNSPLDGEGNVRLSGSFMPRGATFTKIIDGLVFQEDPQVTLSFPTSGPSRYAVFGRLTCLTPPLVGGAFSLTVNPEFGGDGVFAPITSIRAAIPSCRSIGVGEFAAATSGLVNGPEIRFRLRPGRPTLPGSVSLEVWLYLTD